MDVAWLRDRDVIHTGEALMLACLLHAKGKTQRGQEELTQVAAMLDDPNVRKPNAKRRSRNRNNK